MKETGIIMSGNHPKLILDGIKTQTRRTQGLNKVNEKPNDWTVDLQGNIAAFRNIHTGEDVLIRCPYGQVGDRLWVRETWAVEPVFDTVKPNHIYDLLKPKKPLIYYPADETIIQHQGFTVSTILDHGGGAIGRTRPSIHMPRWASRITLEITEVRVERVNQITAEDAIAEGIESRDEEWVYQEANGDKHLLDFTTPEYKRYDGKGYDWTRCPQLSFRTLWDSLNAKRGYGFDVNSWVWPITFKEVPK